MDARTAQAIELMDGFVERTGVTGDGSRRYLWTDAFAVCNLLALTAATGDGRHAEVGLRLIDRVHHVLGRHRPDDARQGWISGRAPQDGEAHPTCGGLRIGKPLPERAPGDPFDEQGEWDRDGQYFHYLTKWMLALDQAARALHQPTFNRWARELAVAAHRGFRYQPPGGARPRLVWKASIDLSRPLVSAMGQHDALDGWLTCLQLDRTAADLGDPAGSLAKIAADFERMVDLDGLSTTDPLGVGGLLLDAHRAASLERRGCLSGRDRVLPALLDAAAGGLQAWSRQAELRLPASRRLAFRELGLAIGLDAVTRLEPGVGTADERTLVPRLAAVTDFAPLGGQLAAFWSTPAARGTETWRQHQDIDDVMLATALLPDGVLFQPSR